MILLDTHALVWFVAGVELRPSARRLVQEALTARDVVVSTISAWELGMFVAKGRLELPLSPKRYFEKLLRRPDVAGAVVTAPIAELAARLPGLLHGDPADRIIVATAIELDCRLVTRDAHIIDYAKAFRALNVVPC